MSGMENIQYPAPKQEYKVLVRCYTFNHSEFIEDALNGFVMQQTNFPFVCLVVDDASTDGAQEVIKTWMERECDMSRAETIDIPTSIVIIVPHKKNLSCTFAFYLLKQNLYRVKGGKLRHVTPWREKCEYEAMCEGDDYWIDSLKLQKQVDFLDEHKNFSICSHRIYRYDQDTNIYYQDCLDNMFHNHEGYIFNNRTRVWISETSSIVFRISCDKEYLNYPQMTRDNVHVYFLLKAGCGFCMTSKMSVYRQHVGGIFSKQDNESRLVNGSYKSLKLLYEFERTPDSQYLYYRAYANTFISTKGGILFNEPFSFKKFFSLFFYIPIIIIGKHPVYRPIRNYKG